MDRLDTCHCCEPALPATPLSIWNRPGRSSLACRVGSFASFRAAMLAALARELPELTTRTTDDHGITLIELWAALGDVLTFYQERIANEARLRTALHRSSVRMLAGHLAYQPRPGLSAETDLALTLDDGAALVIQAGVRVMSLPGAGEQPQVFETLEPCHGIAALNRLRARPVPEPDRPLSAGRDRALLLDGGPAIVAGDRLVFWTGDALEEKRVVAVLPEAGLRRLVWSPPLARDLPPAPAPITHGHAHRIRRSLRFFGWNAPESHSSYDPGRYDPATGRWDPPPAWQKVSLLGRLGLPEAATGPAPPTWPLDGEIEGLTPGTKLLVQNGDVVRLATVTSVAEAPRQLGPLEATVTVLTLSGVTGLAIGDRRTAHVLEVEPDALAFQDRAWPPRIAGGRLTLDPDPGVPIERGRRLLVDDGKGRVHAAEVTGSAVLGDGTRAVDFSPALPAAIDADDATLWGNVARAGHGETQPPETLGDGDGGAVFQSWTLGKPDLSRRPSARSTLGEPELTLLADGVRWQPVASLYGEKPDATVFRLAERDDRKARLTFGDGRTGARLPTGSGNVVARYRRGSGLAGLVAAHRLGILLNRPPGLRDATNPAPAEGGADPETAGDARAKAPASVRTFGRIVALDDFARVATASGEIAKARADRVWRGLDGSVHLTVAAEGGSPLSPVAMARLHAALDAARDPNRVLLVQNALAVPIVVEARLVVGPSCLRAAVLEAAAARLLEHLSFARAELGRPLHASRIITVLQATDGVDGVDLDRLHFKGWSSWSPAALAARGATSAPGQPHLRLFGARPAQAALADPLAAPLLAAGHEVIPAELATLARSDLALSATGGMG